MALKKMSRLEIVKSKMNALEKEISEVEEETVNILKAVLEELFFEESLYEIKDYLEELIANWEEEEIEPED